MVNGEKLSKEEAQFIVKYIDEHGPLERHEIRRVFRVMKTKNLTRRKDGNFGCYKHNGEHRFKLHRGVLRGYKGSLLVWQSSCGEKLTPKEWWDNLLTFGLLRGSIYDPIPPQPVVSRPVPEVPQVIRELEIREVVLVLCPYCGTKNPQGTIKCSHCGASI